MKRLTHGQKLVIDHLRSAGYASTMDLALLFHQSTYRVCSRLHGMAAAGYIIKVRAGKPGAGGGQDAIWALPPNEKGQRPPR